MCPAAHDLRHVVANVCVSPLHRLDAESLPSAPIQTSHGLPLVPSRSAVDCHTFTVTAIFFRFGTIMSIKTAIRPKPCYGKFVPGLDAALAKSAKEAFLANMAFYFPKGVNRSEFARKIGVTPSTLTRWIEGDREPSFADLDKIAAGLGKSVLELLRHPADPPAEMTYDFAYRMLGELVPKIAKDTKKR